MRVIKIICTAVGAVYIVLSVLGSLDAIDLKTCVSNAGRCHITIADQKEHP